MWIQFEFHFPFYWKVAALDDNSSSTSLLKVHLKGPYYDLGLGSERSKLWSFIGADGSEAV